MSQAEHPTLSPGLIDKLKAMDIQSISDLVAVFEADPSNARLPNGVARIKAADAVYVADVETRETPEPVWPVEPVAGMDDEIYAISVPSSLKLHGTTYTFLVTADFQNLAVPLSILSPFQYMPDPILRRWHWWRGEGADSLGTIKAAQVLAKQIVCGYEGIRYEDANPRTLAKKFEVATAKATHVFMSWGNDWKGLWAPVYMRPEAKPDERAAMFTCIFTESEIAGEGQVKRQARKMAKRYDKIRIKPRMPAMSAGPYKGMYVPLKTQAKWEVLQRWMAAGRPDGCSLSKVIQNLIEDAYGEMPDEGDWPDQPYVSKNMKPPEPDLLRPDEKLKLSARQKEVLGAAMRLSRPGCPVTPKAIARIVGITPNNVSLVIGALRRKGIWPYTSPEPGRKTGRLKTRVSTPRDEENAARDIVARLLRLSDPEARRRVLNMVEGAGEPESN